MDLPGRLSTPAISTTAAIFLDIGLVSFVATAPSSPSVRPYWLQFTSSIAPRDYC